MTTRKQYTREFKQDAVRLVTEQGYKQTEAARNLGIDRGMLGRWIKEFQEDEQDHVIYFPGSKSEPLR